VIDFRGLIITLADGGVEFVIVGGVAASIHGSAFGTSDVDVVYRRSPENIRRLVDALVNIHPRLRGAPTGLPFRFDAPTIRAGLNFTLTTDLGDLDLIGEIIGGGSYEDLLDHSAATFMFDRSCRVVLLSKLIELKRAAGRRKDLERLAELELLEERLSDSE
jgi:predicted nucleotidyltransferase